jgi:hypothetical protein
VCSRRWRSRSRSSSPPTWRTPERFGQRALGNEASGRQIWDSAGQRTARLRTVPAGNLWLVQGAILAAAMRCGLETEIACCQKRDRAQPSCNDAPYRSLTCPLAQSLACCQGRRPLWAREGCVRGGWMDGWVDGTRQRASKSRQTIGTCMGSAGGQHAILEQPLLLVLLQAMHNIREHLHLGRRCFD